MSRLTLAACCAVIACAIAAPAAHATDLSGALVSSSDCTENALNRNDDSYTSSVPMPFEVNFFGRKYSSLWVNNNGNVTFDAPLSTYTPFGLQAASRAIIAPFFADVDTRGSGSDIVRYGWGETTYFGRRALCVNWVNVGYYNARYDKRNSFQLLLVDRGAGDFDIVFNYGSIQWETGDASGGSGGLGGSSARVGYANGDGSAINSYELPGSGVNGALLDVSTRGLIHDSIGSVQDGRYIFSIRNGVSPNQYVALGNSFQSGVGAGDYDGTACKRSDNAYAHELVNRGATPWALRFGACSGATIPALYDDVLDSPDALVDGKTQMGLLDADTTALVTLGIGGNDVEFADVLKGCLARTLLDIGSCEAAYEGVVDNQLDDLLEHHDHEKGLNRFQQLYADVRSGAPRAQALVVDYPKFFPPDGATDFTELLLDPFTRACQLVRVSDQIWINAKIRELNAAIGAAAQSMGLDHVSMYTTSDGRELCSDAPPEEKALTGLVPSEHTDSFHPTAAGHDYMADRLEDRLQPAPEMQVATAAAPGEEGQTVERSYLVHQDEVHEEVFTVGGTPSVAFNTSWPGSDVEMVLTSPSGRVIGRDVDAADVFHQNGPTFETYVVRNPEQGAWRVTLRGLDVEPEGEETKLRFFAQAPRNVNPLAEIDMSVDGRTVSVDAARSSDADGEVVDHLWDFGDGHVARGREATHTYSTAGTYRVTLVVKDDRGGLGFATAEQNIVVPAYEFAGFFAPVNNPPTVNAVQAGRAVPVKFSLGGDHGLDIFDEGHPRSQRIDCDTRVPVDEIEQTDTAGRSELTYDAVSGRYQYVWKTEAAWAGTCRRLVLGLDDGSRHTADFRLR